MALPALQVRQDADGQHRRHGRYRHPGYTGAGGPGELRHHAHPRPLQLRVPLIKLQGDLAGDANAALTGASLPGVTPVVTPPPVPLTAPVTVVAVDTAGNEAASQILSPGRRNSSSSCPRATLTWCCSRTSDGQNHSPPDRGQYRRAGSPLVSRMGLRMWTLDR